MLSVVPEYKLHALGDLGAYLLGDHDVLVVVAVVVVANAEVHIRPHHHAQTVLVGDADESFHKFVEDFKGRHVAVLVEEFASAHIPRLVHAYMYSLGAEGGGNGGDKLLNEFKGLFLPCQKHGVGVLNAACLRPHKVFLHMGVALKAGDYLDAVLVRVVIYLADILYGIYAAHITEVGATVQLDHVLGVQHHHIVSHNRNVVKKSLYRGNSRHAAS